MSSNRLHRLERVCQLLSVVALLSIFAACGDIETTPAPDAEEDQDVAAEMSGDVPEDSTDPPMQPMDQGFVLEPYAPGADWYDYEESTHTLTPTPGVYVVEARGERFAFAVESYYDERGESGVFTLVVRRRSPSGGWAPAVSHTLGGNIKDGTLCVDMLAPADVECQSDSWHLLFRIDARIVPAAGFSVGNPAIYPAGHWLDSDEAGLVAFLAGAELDSLEDELAESDELPVLPSAMMAPSHAVLAEDTLSGSAFLMATADNKLAQWRAELSSSSGGSDFVLTVKCAALADNPTEQQALPDTSHTVQFALSGGSYNATLFDLCGDEGVQRVEERGNPYRGLWPETRSFDLLIEEAGDQTVIRISPGALLHRTHRALDGMELPDVSVPTSLWEE